MCSYRTRTTKIGQEKHTALKTSPNPAGHATACPRATFSKAFDHSRQVAHHRYRNFWPYRHSEPRTPRHYNIILKGGTQATLAHRLAWQHDHITSSWSSSPMNWSSPLWPPP